jgi:hypothetical protein
MNTIDVTVEVTQRDIDAGCRNSASACPIANAIHRVTREPHSKVRRVKVQFPSYLSSPCDSRLPEEACAFIHNFDTGFPVFPFSFTLAVPEELVKR